MADNNLGSFPPPSSSRLQVNSSVVVIVMVLSVVLLCSGVLHLLARCLGWRRSLPPTEFTAAGAHSNSLRRQLQYLFQLHDAGVDQAFIDSLPVFLYGTIRGLKDGADCAVCLSEFGEEDRLRLLPGCKHAFHLECIDTWLLSNSTCPLCRQSLLHGHSFRSTSGSRSRAARGLAQSLVVPTDSTSATCAQAFAGEPNTQRRGSSFRTCDPTDSSCNLEFELVALTTLDRDSSSLLGQEQGSLHPVSPVSGPTVCVAAADGSEKMMRVGLGKVKFDSRGGDGSDCANNGFEQGTSTSSGSCTRSHEPAAAKGRSYSMGSYQYIVDSSSFELSMAPTPYPGRSQLNHDYWTGAPRLASNSKPTHHRNILSDMTTELVITAAAGATSTTPANENHLFSRASRGLNTRNSRLSHVRELTMMTPSPAYTACRLNLETLNQESHVRRQSLQAELHDDEEARDHHHHHHQQQQWVDVLISYTGIKSLESKVDEAGRNVSTGHESHDVSSMLWKKSLRQTQETSCHNCNSQIIKLDHNLLETRSSSSSSSSSAVAATVTNKIKEMVPEIRRSSSTAARSSSSVRLNPRDKSTENYANFRWLTRSLSDQTAGLGSGLGFESQ